MASSSILIEHNKTTRTVRCFSDEGKNTGKEDLAMTENMVHFWRYNCISEETYKTRLRR